MSNDSPTNKLIVVAGPTASGKTSFAINLALKLDGELISADSRQIYKYLDIGTNKGITSKVGEIKIEDGDLPIHEIDSSGINIHLLSFLEPDVNFDAFTFRKYFNEIYRYVVSTGKQPILVGGTGLYIDLIINHLKYSNVTSPDPDLRKELNSLSRTELQSRLKEISNDSYEKLNQSDRQNPRRLIRSIEKVKTNKRSHKEETIQIDSEVYFLTPELVELTDRLNNRVDEMFNAGLLNEVKQVLDMGYDENSVALQGIGYAQVLKMLKNEISESECIQKIKIEHRKYAKRQLTWFRKHLPADITTPV